MALPCGLEVSTYARVLADAASFTGMRTGKWGVALVVVALAGCGSSESATTTRTSARVECAEGAFNADRSKMCFGGRMQPFETEPTAEEKQAIAEQLASEEPAPMETTRHARTATTEKTAPRSRANEQRFTALDDLAIQLDEAIGQEINAPGSSQARLAELHRKIRTVNEDALLDGEDPWTGGTLLQSAAFNAVEAAKQGDTQSLIRQRREIDAARSDLAAQAVG